MDTRQKNTVDDDPTGNVGRQMQMSLVPADLSIFSDYKEFDVYGTLVPAREVGGDFYDFFLIDEDRFCCLIGDVSGKGMKAIMFMSVAKTLIKSMSMDDLSTASILTRANDELCRHNEPLMFTTTFMGILNNKTGSLVYTNAGHHPSYIKRKKGPIERLDRLHGPALGVKNSQIYSQEKTQLLKDDILLLYTDGVINASNPGGQLFSQKRMAALIGSREFESARDLVNSTIEAVKQFQDGKKHIDDMAMLALQFLKTPETSTSRRMELTIYNRLSEHSRIRQHIDSFSKQHHLPQKLRLKINVVLDELITNIISYAYHDDKEHHITIVLDLSADRLMVQVADDGIPFNPLAMDKPDTQLSLDDRKIGGLGIHLVRHMMSKVAYQRRVGKNVITMIEYLNPD